MKKVLSILLSILMAFSAFSVMPFSAFAEETYDLKVGGTQVTSENCENIPAAAGYEEYSGKASFDATTNTLTLENYTYKGKGAAFGNGQEGFGIAIGFSSQTTLVLKGTNTITVTSHNNNGDSYGIICGNGSLLIKGNGVLNVTSAPVSTESYGISIGVYANNALTIEGGTINATGDAGRKSYGIKAFEEISITEDAVSVSAAGQTCAFAVLLGDDYRTLTTGKGGYAYTDVEGTENETVIPHGVHNHTELAAYKKITLDRVIHNFSGKTCSYCGAKNPDYIFTGKASDLVQGDKFQMGMYPQTKVTDSVTITALGAIDCTMTSYGYIANYNKDNGNYDNVDMTYADIAYNGDLYRKVNINEYRPSDTTKAPTAEKSNQDNNGYEAGNTYYFKWEPVVWQVLAKEADGVRVMSESLLDSQDFYKCTSDTITWETGDLRSWLNGDFCNAVFSEGEKGKIVPDTHENGLGNNTTDTLWLLSQSEVTNSAYGFSSDKNNEDVARRAQGTDYAKCQGITVLDLGCSEWSLRSVVFKDYTGYNNNYIVQVHGGASSICGFGNTELGVRPAFKLNLNATVSSSDSATCRVTGDHDYGDGYVCTVCGNVKEVTSVRNYADLKELARQVNAGNDYAGKTVVLENDIICKNNENDTDYATDWVPIGNESTPFKGTFDGKGYTITGLSTAENITASYVGLFGYVNGGTIQNVGLEGGVIKGKRYVGGVAGYLGGTVTNCYNTGEVSGSDNVGGIVGLAGGTVTNCYNTGAVVGANGTAGGVCGNLNGQAVVQRCYNTGAVRGSLDVGGVAGNMLNSGIITVQDCYNTGAVTGITVNNSSPKVGGIVGHVGGTVVKNCYNTGEVSGSDNVGGVAGDNSKNRLQNCYYDKTICSAASASGNTADTDNVKGLTTAQMTGTNALDNMVFTYGDGEGNPWLVKPDGDGYWYYPHLKGFDFGGDEGDGTQEVGGVVGYDTGGSVGNNYNTGSVNTQLTADKIDAENWPAKAEVSITWNGDSTYTYSGSNRRIVPTSVKVNNVELTAGEGYGVKYMKNNAGNWVETNDTINVGEYRTVIFFLRAVVEDEVIKYITDDSHSEITKDFEIEPKSLTNASITLSADSVTYDGNDVAKPTVSVEDDQNNSVPASGYDVSYTDGDWKNAGKYKVTVTGKGNYKDSAEATFEIKKKALTVTAKDRTYTYNGSAQGENNKTYTTDLDSKVMVSGLQGSDKLTSITLNGQETNAGTYNDKIVASAAAIGDATANYDITYVAGKLTIDPKPITITINGNSKEVTYNGGEQTFNGTFTPTSSDTMFDASKFVYSGSTSVSGTNVNTYTLSPVTSNAAYNDDNFTASFVAGDPVKLTINKANANVTVVGNNNTSEYDEKEHVVTDYVATSDNDLYDVTKFFTFSGIAEAKRTKVGTTAMGLVINQFTNINTNFNVTFNVTDGYQKITAQPMDEKALDVTLDDITYDGTAKEPVVKVGDTVLEKDKDYEITYKDADGNAVDSISGAGEYTVTITGKGNYSGEVTKTVTVEPKAITITAEDKKSNLGDSLKGLTYKVDGTVINGDELNVKLSTAADAYVAGEYDITVTAENANYTITLVNGKYTVVDKVLHTEKEEAEEAINAAAKGESSANAVTIYWGKVKKADKIVVYAAYCGKNHRGKYKKIATLKGNATKYDITKLNGKKLNQKKNVKAYVVAYRKVNGKYKKITKSLNLHVAGYKSKRTNTKAIKLKKSKFTLKKGKTAKIKGSIVLEDSSKKAVNHVRKLRFKSSNKKVATVSRSGKIKAKGKGTCWVYVFANNGKAKKVKVTVK